MKNRRWIKHIGLALVLMSISILGYSQVPTDSLPGDPGAISVYTIQNMSFGAFTQGASGGTVIISNSGVRSVTGTVVGLNLGIAYFHSIFEIEAPTGTIISILNGPDATLTGSNGGSMTMQINSSSPASPFSTTVPPTSRTQVKIGGTLNVGNSSASPPGVYTGTFFVTFNQE